MGNDTRHDEGKRARRALVRALWAGGLLAAGFEAAFVDAGCTTTNTFSWDAGVHPGPPSTTNDGATVSNDAALPDAAPADAGAADARSDAGPVGCITPTTPQSCTPPEKTALPICKLSQTGCMSTTQPTQFAANAIYYEVNSPLWSDNAAKSRAFVMPDGGTIHVKDCEPDAGADQLAADCTSPMGIPNGPADTGKWVFPVGTVMIKNFMFDGKLVETRLFMHVDGATAAIIQNGTDWVGYNYAWNEAQTEATVVPNARTSVSFNTGTHTIQWNYPNFIDCIGCHSPAVSTIGPETDQMNRVVDGGNQIDRFVAMGLFDDTAPQQPYTTALVEPYANAALGLSGPPAGATTEQEARSYLSANCGFCHRPDVNDQGFDLRYALPFYRTGICNLTEQNGIPGMSGTYVDFDPGNHAMSALWIRMNIPVPSSDPNEVNDVGRMPSVASFVVDQQATNLIASWIDSVTSCPGPDGGPDGGE
jgi:cytochrome c551/c552